MPYLTLTVLFGRGSAHWGLEGGRETREPVLFEQKAAQARRDHQAREYEHQPPPSATVLDLRTTAWHGSEEGSYLRLMSFFITQLLARES